MTLRSFLGIGTYGKCRVVIWAVWVWRGWWVGLRCCGEGIGVIWGNGVMVGFSLKGVCKYGWC